jgi:hypothetical protein
MSARRHVFDEEAQHQDRPVPGRQSAHRLPTAARAEGRPPQRLHPGAHELPELGLFVPHAD